MQINKRYINTLNNLRKDQSIIICKQDKGNGIVLLDKNDYLTKINCIINDSNKFTKINSDWFKMILKQEDKFNRFLSQLKKNKDIDESLYNELYSSGTQPGILYGLPKVHKENTPVRPILSAINTCGYKTAKLLTPLLESITKNEYTVPDSFTFVREMKNLQLDNCTMASFDIKSLFTNIPLHETIEIAANNFYDVLDTPILGLSKQLFKKLLNFATKDILFIFNNNLYTQNDGCAMGSPLGPTLANIFLCHHEENWIRDCPVEFRPLLYRRYIDDTFLLFRTPDNIPAFLQYLNSQHSNIQFTSEIENNNKLSFLDVLVQKYENNFDTSVFRKKSHTDLGLNFNSFIPHKFKSNYISCFVQRAFKLCSTERAFSTEILYLKKF